MNRFSGRAVFQHLFQSGAEIRGEGLSAAALPNGRRNSRLRLVIQRKAQLSGVKRNRYKRWLREAFRLHQEKCPAGLDLVIIVSKPPKEKTFQGVQGSVLNILKILDLQKKPWSCSSTPTSG